MQAGIHRKDISSVKSQIFDQTRDILFKIQAIPQIRAFLLRRNNAGHCKIHGDLQGLFHAFSVSKGSQQNAGKPIARTVEGSVHHAGKRMDIPVCGTVVSNCAKAVVIIRNTRQNHIVASEF